MSRVKIFILAVGLLIIARLAWLVVGGASSAVLASEIGCLFAIVAVGSVAFLGFETSSSAGRALVGMMLVVLCAGVVVPLWRQAHEARLLSGVIGGAQRELTTAPAAASGRYSVELELTSDNGADSEELVTVIAGPNSRTLRIAGDAVSDAVVFLEAGEAARVTAHFATHSIRVEVRPIELPWSFVAMAGALAIFLAGIGDFVLFRGRHSLRGLLVMSVTCFVVYEIQLVRAIELSWRNTVGSAIVGMLVGGLAGGIFALATGRFARACNRGGAR